MSALPYHTVILSSAYRIAVKTVAFVAAAEVRQVWGGAGSLGGGLAGAGGKAERDFHPSLERATGWRPKRHISRECSPQVGKQTRTFFIFMGICACAFLFLFEAR